MAHAARLTRPAKLARIPGLGLLLCALLPDAATGASLEAGLAHNLVITPTGEVRAWGLNEAGQLGNGTTMSSSVLVRSGSLTNVIAVAAGASASVALRSNQTVWTWGQGATLGQAAPQQCLVPNEFSSTPVFVPCSKVPLQVPGLTGITAIAAGGNHVVALRSNGTLAAWGENALGQLGDGTAIARTAPVNVPGITNVVAIAAGEAFTVALKGDGTVWSWGVSEQGELGYQGPNTCTGPDAYGFGNKDQPCALSPQQVAGISGVTAISARGRHVLALKADGSVWTWGSNRYGQLGRGSTVDSYEPILVAGMSPAARIEAGFSQSFVVKADGTFWAFGLNGATGLLGFLQSSGTVCSPGLSNYCSKSPVAVPQYNGVAQIVSGTAHTLVVRANGAIESFGVNNSGQRGFGFGPFTITYAWMGDPHMPNAGGATSSGGSLGTASNGTGFNLTSLDEGMRFTSSGVNVTSAPAGVRFSNLQETEIGIVSVAVTGNFAIPTHDCPATLPSNASCTIQVTFTPTGPGERLGTLSVTTNSAENSTVSLELSGTTPTATHELAIMKVGAGSGTVTSNPAGLTCGTTCTLGFESGTIVTLLPAPAGGSAFAGWDGACSGLANCAVSMTQARSVTAAFNVASTGNLPRAGPPSLFFGSQAVSYASAAQPMTITNPGPSAFTSFSIETSAPYSVTHACAGTLAAGAFCNISVVFTPTVQGLASGALTVTTNLGSYTVSLSGIGVDPPRLSNIATRGPVFTGDSVMIAGFIIGGSTSKTVIVRARGPSLSQFGVPGVLANPELTLYSGQSPIATNDNWGQAANFAAIQASGLAPENAQEAAILTTLAPGPYTAIVNGVGGVTGIAIVEVFEVSQVTTPLVNIATRGAVQTGDNVMIAGFIIEGDGPQTVVVRARGPSMAQFGVPNLLANPTLTLYSGQTALASNDNWGDAANAAAIQASTFAPQVSVESAILMTLQPGPYTAIVSGVGGTSGIAIVEVFRVP